MNRDEVQLVNRIVGLMIVGLAIFISAQFIPRYELKGIKVYGKQEVSTPKPYFEIGR